MHRHPPRQARGDRGGRCIDAALVAAALVFVVRLALLWSMPTGDGAVSAAGVMAAAQPQPTTPVRATVPAPPPRDSVGLVSPVNVFEPATPAPRHARRFPAPNATRNRAHRRRHPSPRPPAQFPRECADYRQFAADPEAAVREAGRWAATRPGLEWSDAESGEEATVAGGYDSQHAKDEAANAAEFLAGDRCTVEKVALADLSPATFRARYRNRAPVVIQVRRTVGSDVPRQAVPTTALSAAALGQFQALTQRGPLLYCFGGVDLMSVNGTAEEAATGRDPTQRVPFGPFVREELPAQRDRSTVADLGPGFYFSTGPSSSAAHAAAHGVRDHAGGGGGGAQAADFGTRGSWGPLLAQFPRPVQFIVGAENQREANMAFGVGGSGSGVNFHQHGAVFLSLLHGRKRWWLRDPAAGRPRFTPGRSTAEWFREEWPAVLRAAAGGAEADDGGAPLPPGYHDCAQRPGEVLYLPPRWWHATMNVGDTVSVGTFFVD